MDCSVGSVGREIRRLDLEKEGSGKLHVRKKKIGWRRMRMIGGESDLSRRAASEGRFAITYKSSVDRVSRAKRTKRSFQTLTSEAPVVFMRSYCFRNAR